MAGSRGSGWAGTHGSDELAAFVYSAVYPPDLADPQVARFVASMVAAGQALDLGSGTGRMTIPAAVAGATVTAVENDPAARARMLTGLDRAAGPAPGVRERVVLLADDARTVRSAERFGMIAACGVMPYLVAQGDRSALFETIVHHLRVAGRALVTVPPPSFEPATYRRHAALEDGCAAVRTVDRCRRPGGWEAEVRSEIVRGDRVLATATHRTALRPAPRRELQRQLVAAGLCVLAEEAGTWTLVRRADVHDGSVIQ